jgi:hypothetical protein
MWSDMAVASRSRRSCSDGLAALRALSTEQNEDLGKIWEKT